MLTGRNSFKDWRLYFKSLVYSKFSNMTISWDDFIKVDIRAGTIVEVNDFPKARKPAYKLLVDFGELGLKWSSAQITAHYKKEDLLNQQVIAVVNFPPKQIADFISECLVLGVYDDNNDVVLIHPGKIFPTVVRSVNEKTKRNE